MSEDELVEIERRYFEMREREPTWYKVKGLTTKQEDVLRKWAGEWGFKDLRGLSTFLESLGWDYYDVIKIEYE